jgi:hypothetical protein
MLLRLISQRRLVCRFEWLTAFPALGPLPQQSQNLDITYPSPQTIRQKKQPAKYNTEKKVWEYAKKSP